MVLLPIELDESKNQRFLHNANCAAILSVYPEFYKKVGFNRPWIGYFASFDGTTIIGGGGFKGKPADGKVEIAYTAFSDHEGKGIGTQICKELVQLALKTDPSIRVTARTLQDGHASIAILKKNGFTCLGIVNDADDGDVFEWEYAKA